VSKNIIKASASHLPAVIDEADSYRGFEKFVKMADQLAEIFDELGDVKKLVAGGITEKQLRSAQKTLDGFEDDGWRDRIMDCERQLEQFNPDDAFDDDFIILKAQVSKHLAMLIGSFLSGAKNVPNMAVFTGRLLNEVWAAEPSVVVLESACRQLVRSESDFMPGIGKVLAAIKDQDEIWKRRLRAIDYCCSRADQLKTMLAKLAEKFAAEKVPRLAPPGAAT
jgi:hypothetical protein